MTDQPKKKPVSAKTRNDARRNGKAAKKSPSDFRLGNPRNFRGPHARPVRLSELEKALLGGGAMRRIERRLTKDPVKPLAEHLYGAARG